MSNKKNRLFSLCLLAIFLLSILSNNASAVKRHEASFDDLSDYYSTQAACNGDEEDCSTRIEYKFYLKMYDIYYLYKNKYKVTLDLPLIMSTLFYNNDQMINVFEMNLNDYNHSALVESNWNPRNTTNLDWEYNYESLPNYLVYNDSSYDMQILAKNMVTKTTVQSCVDSDGKKTKTEKIKDTEDDLECEEGERLEKGSSTYKLDYDKYDNFLLEYIEKKYFIRKMVDENCIVRGNSNSTTNLSNSSNVAGNIIIGDSRTVGLCMSVFNKSANECSYSTSHGIQIDNDYIIAEGSMGSTWLKNTAIPAVGEYLDAHPGKTYNIITYMGVNGLDIDNYISIYNEAIDGDWKNHNVVLVSVNPVNEEIESQYGYSVRNSNIESFNSKLKRDVSSDNVLYCDTYSQIKDSFTTFDGLHYEKTTYENIYNLTKSCISDGGISISRSSSCSSRIGGSFDGNIIYYNQGDYSAYPYGSYGTIQSHGCGPSSLAIVISSMLGEEHDPVEMTDHVCSIGGCTGAGTTLAAIGQTIEDYGLHYEQTTDSQKVYDALATGDALVIASMGPGHFTTGGHYITITAANGDNIVTVSDPGNRYNNHEWDMSLIAAETNYGFWIVTR